MKTYFPYIHTVQKSYKCTAAAATISEYQSFFQVNLESQIRHHLYQQRTIND